MTASVISKITVNPKNNGFTTTERKPTTDISLENLQDFVKLFWMAASKVIAKDKKCPVLALKSPLLPQLMPF